VVNVDRYLEHASGNAATTYFAMLGSVDPVSAASIDLSAVSDDEINQHLGARLDPQLLRVWLTAQSGRLRAVANLLIELAPEFSENDEDGGQLLADAFVELLGDSVWEALARAGRDLPLVLAHRAVWQQWAQQTQVFRTHLEAADWDEPSWQRFFEENEWIFGYGLRPQFLHLLQERPSLGGRDVSRTGEQEGDFLMATEAVVGFTVLVEIKRPDCELVRDTQYRNRTYELGRELVAGVVQLQTQCWRWAVVGSREDENRDILETHGVFTHEPHSILVVGDTSTLGGNRDKLRTFEGFRRNLWRPEVLTYDELLRRTELMVSAQLGERPEPDASDAGATLVN
jgi:hypothetical protein